MIQLWVLKPVIKTVNFNALWKYGPGCNLRISCWKGKYNSCLFKNSIKHPQWRRRRNVVALAREYVCCQSFLYIPCLEVVKLCNSNIRTSIDRHQLQMQHPSFPRQRDSMKHSASMLCWYIIDSHILAPVAGCLPHDHFCWLVHLQQNQDFELQF